MTRAPGYLRFIVFMLHWFEIGCFEYKLWCRECLCASAAHEERWVSGKTIIHFDLHIVNTFIYIKCHCNYYCLISSDNIFLHSALLHICYIVYLLKSVTKNTFFILLHRNKKCKMCNNDVNNIMTYILDYSINILIHWPLKQSH